jgi:hypothetical protein
MSTTEQVKTILLFAILALICVILILILINAVRRTFCHKHNNDDDLDGKHERCVDFFVNDENSFPKGKVVPGMTALIDKGVTNMETGIYMYYRTQPNRDTFEWAKFAVPEEGERYHILDGEMKGKRYTIRRSFLNEMRPPTETQIIDNTNLVQDLKDDTSIVHVAPNVESLPRLIIATSLENANVKPATPSTVFGRHLRIQNTSPIYPLTVVIGKKEIMIGQSTIRDLYLNADHSHSGRYYTFGAMT